MIQERFKFFVKLHYITRIANLNFFALLSIFVNDHILIILPFVKENFGMCIVYDIIGMQTANYDKSGTMS